MLKAFITFTVFFILTFSGAQNQLPILNGAFETLDPNGDFSYWSNTQNNGGQAVFSIETSNLISGSTKALKSQITQLGTNNWDVKTKSNYQFQVIAGEIYTVSFWAKVEGGTSEPLKVVFQSDASGSYQGANKTITNQWQLFSHSFTVESNSDLNELIFWYMQSGVTYYLDEVTVFQGDYVSLDLEASFQTVEGFGAGIKRRTEDLYNLSDAMRQQIEAYCFQDLEVNMIRFFVYHDLEVPNDNSNAFNLDTSQLDWTRYNSNPTIGRSRYVAEALTNAFNLSINGFDHVIGNCNSAPYWLKTNNSHTNGGTLISGQEDEYSEFLVGFIKGMQSNYGINVTAISPTNEPDYDVTYESMNTSPSELSSILINLNERLDSELLPNVKVLSPETFRVSSNDLSKSTTNYVNELFMDSNVVNAVDVVATHTYQNPINDSDWGALKTASLDKSIWVTESGNLHSPDFDMTDASYQINRIFNGFVYGGLSAYMGHLFYEKHDYETEVETGQNFGSSALVLWDNNNQIILPKRYFVFKHFANLIKPGYQRIQTSLSDNGLLVMAFKSADGTKVVVQLFNESSSETKAVSLETAAFTAAAQHFITSDSAAHNYSLIEDIEFSVGDSHISFDLPPLSMHSIEYTIDTSLSNSNTTSSNPSFPTAKVYPNPSDSQLSIEFPSPMSCTISVFSLNGIKIMDSEINQESIHKLNTAKLSSGFYILKFQEQGLTKQVIKFIKK
jgi:O-glycosyl hydrolase